MCFLFVSVYIDFNVIYPLLDIIWHAAPPSKNSENQEDHVSSTSQP